MAKGFGTRYSKRYGWDPLGGTTQNGESSVVCTAAVSAHSNLILQAASGLVCIAAVSATGRSKMFGSSLVSGVCTGTGTAALSTHAAASVAGLSIATAGAALYLYVSALIIGRCVATGTADSGAIEYLRAIYGSLPTNVSSGIYTENTLQGAFKVNRSKKYIGGKLIIFI